MKRLKTYKKFNEGVKSDFIKDTFLKLTEYTIPFEQEYKLEKYLPIGYKKDSIGNYFIQIGESETLFTTHLDTYSKDYKKVNHVIDGDIVKTDGTTILGGDNKLGMTILLYMIKNNVPGTYYFFCGEEPILSGGLYGSQNALESDLEFFKKFKRAIAFDRKQMGSVVTRQRARYCCSNDFAIALSDKLSSNGVPSKPDPNAYYTDTATFMDVIEECTNISAGGWDEHYKTEWVDLSYTRKVAEAAIKIDWENLPVVREVKDYSEIKPITRNINKNVIKKVKDILSRYDLMHTNKKEFENNHSNTLVFNTWFEEINLRITLGEDILVQIEGKDDINFEFNEMDKLNLYLGNIFPIEINYELYQIEAYDDALVVLGYEFDNLDDYLKHFDMINSDDTSYILHKGGEQFKDHFGVIPKDMVIKWFKDNI